MAETNRRKAIAAVVIVVLAVAAIGVAMTLTGGDGVGDGDGGADTGESPQSQTTEIKNITAISDNGGQLRIEVEGDQAKNVTLLHNGSKVLASDIDPNESVGTLPLSQLEPTNYTLVVMSEQGETVSERAYRPEIDISVPQVERRGGMDIANFYEKRHQAAMYLKLNNTGEVDAGVSTLVISDGFPLEVQENANRFGDSPLTERIEIYDMDGMYDLENDNKAYTLPALGGKAEYVFDAGQYTNPEVLTPPNDACDGEEYPLEMTVVLSNAANRTISMNVTLDGEYAEANYVSGEGHCTDTQIEIDSVETVDN
jgi:hypothetical protein